MLKFLFPLVEYHVKTVKYHQYNMNCVRVLGMCKLTCLRKYSPTQRLGTEGNQLRVLLRVYWNLEFCLNFYTIYSILVYRNTVFELCLYYPLIKFMPLM